MMLQEDTFTVFILICVLTPIVSIMLLGFISIFEKQIDSLKEEKRSLELEKDLQTANLIKLNQQIKPHFFFNTLNVITSLARLDRKTELITAIESLSHFLKYQYKNHEQLISIREEIMLIEKYFVIQRLRFGDRIQLILQIEKETEQLKIPPFFLQTFVENAFKHGFEKFTGLAEMSIKTRLIDHVLEITVMNTKNGAVMPTNYEESGYGFTNIEAVRHVAN